MRPRHRALWPAALVLGLAQAASAQPSDPPPAPDYGRNGFYLGLGGVWGRPAGWEDDVHADVGKSMAELSTVNATANAAAMFGNRVSTVDPVAVGLSGSDFEGGTGGIGAVIGYRIGPRGALELEGEWLADLDSSFSIDNTGQPGGVEVSDIWTLSANVRLFALTGRFQPFGIFGVGLQNSTVSTQGQATGITTTANLQNPPAMEQVPADFSFRSSDEQLDGALRVGLGVDAYATERIAAQLKADYVLPFVRNGPVETDYLSVRVGLLYRF